MSQKMILRICPGSGRKLADWSLALGDMESVGECQICGEPVRLRGSRRDRAWKVAQHAQIVEGIDAEERAAS